MLRHDYTTMHSTTHASIKSEINTQKKSRIVHQTYMKTGMADGFACDTPRLGFRQTKAAVFHISMTLGFFLVLFGTCSLFVHNVFFLHSLCNILLSSPIHEKNLLCFTKHPYESRRLSCLMFCHLPNYAYHCTTIISMYLSYRVILRLCTRTIQIERYHTKYALTAIISLHPSADIENT